MLAGNYDEAIKNIAKAMDVNPNERLYDSAILLVRNEQKSHEELKKQE